MFLSMVQIAFELNHIFEITYLPVDKSEFIYLPGIYS